MRLALSPGRLCWLSLRMPRRPSADKAKNAIRAANMSTFTLPDFAPPVSVRLPSDLSQDQLLSFPAFRTWKSALEHSLSLQRSDPQHPFHALPYRLRSIEVQSVDVFRGGRLGFVKLKADVSNDDGESLPGSVFLRGGSVAMMVGSPMDQAPYKWLMNRR